MPGGNGKNRLCNRKSTVNISHPASAVGSHQGEQAVYLKRIQRKHKKLEILM
jgi:hypothetical protein